MPITNKDNVNFIVDGENIDAVVLNRPTDQFADEAERTLNVLGFDREVYSLAEPTLNLRFDKGDVYFRQIDFSRGGDTKTYFDRLGILRTTDVDQPKTTYDPATGESLGLSVHEQRTNLALDSENIGGSGLGGGRSIERDVPEILAPDGTQTVDKLTATVGSSGATSQSIDVVAGRTYVWTIWLAREAGELIRLRANTPDENFSVSFGLVDELKLVRYQGTYQCNTSGTALFGFADVSASNDNPYAYFWGLQVEEGNAASPYIKTTDSQITRAADDAVRTLGSEFNSQEFTIFFDAIRPYPVGVSVNNFLYEIILDENNHLGWRSFEGAEIIQLKIGAQNLINDAVIGEIANGTKIKTALSLSNGVLTYAINGISRDLTFSGDIPNFTDLQIGNTPRAPRYLDGFVISTRLEAKIYTATELEALTS